MLSVICVSVCAYTPVYRTYTLYNISSYSEEEEKKPFQFNAIHFAMHLSLNSIREQMLNLRKLILLYFARIFTT